MATQIEQTEAGNEEWKAGVDARADFDAEVEKQRKWLVEHKADTDLPWSALAKHLGPEINAKSLGLFANGNYAGPEDRFVEAIRRYRLMIVSQAEMQIAAPVAPTFYETETSRQLMVILRHAQRGRIVYAAMGAGCGKTKTAKHFRDLIPNVFLVTIAPSTAGLASMQREVLFKLGEKVVHGSSQTLSRRIKDFFEVTPNGLLIIDEAQHLTTRAIEEIRSWHDESGVGVALLGNEHVQQTLDGGARAATFAQIFSRVGMRLVRSKPLAGDIEAFLDAWAVSDTAARKELGRIAALPGALRTATFVLELAITLASAEKKPLALAHVQNAWAQLAKRSQS
ncbi:MAG: AAA family ATPase [Erythrobacter sp.]|nr:AAA family ATPase [Erythrobacter sp.]NCQ62438.1 AAA family ATPase [Alphaproteobacteria bacterium]